MPPKIPDKTSLFAEDPAIAATAAAATAGGDEVARFEDALTELEGIVERMERGDLALEESLALFERGMKLTASCRTSLDSAELKVRKLLASEKNAPADPADEA